MKYVVIPDVGAGIKLRRVNGEPILQSDTVPLPSELHAFAEELIAKLPEGQREAARSIPRAMERAGKERLPVLMDGFLDEHVLSDERFGKPMKLAGGEAKAYEVIRAATRIDAGFRGKKHPAVVAVEDRDHEITCAILTEPVKPLGQDGKPIEGLTLLGLAPHILRQFWPYIEAFVEAPKEPPKQELAPQG